MAPRARLPRITACQQQSKLRAIFGPHVAAAAAACFFSSSLSASISLAGLAAAGQRLDAGQHAQGAVRLGRPLSEEPEFWRAIPDAECVDWVAEELGLEPGRWDWPRGGFGGDLARGGVGGDRRPVRRAAAGAGELEVAPSSAAPPEGQGYADWLLLNRPFVNAPPRNEVGSRQQAPPTSAALADPRGRAALHALSLMQRGPGVQGEPADQVRRSG